MIMTNKIIIGNEKLPHLIIDKESNIEIIVNKNVENKLIIISNSNYDINITLMENSKLVVNSLNKDNNVNVTINLKENTYINYNHSIMSENNSNNSFIINHLENNSTSIINNNGINMSSHNLFFKIDGIIPQRLSNISCGQNSKIINFSNGNSKIIPNLIIDSNDIVANHSAYIGKIDDEEKFYMASRGLSDIDIKKLIYKSVLLGKMELLEEEEEFNKIINEWW